MEIPPIDLRRQHKQLLPELKEAFEDIVLNTQFIKGEKLKQFESDLATLCKTKHAIGVSNGTAAISLALEACGVKQGDEVIIPAYTFFATAEMVLRVGAKPVFADIDPRTFNITPETVKEKVTDKTTAIICVHVYGQMCDVEGLSSLAKEHNIAFIEDAAQSIGAKWNDHSIGALSDAATISFYPAKNLGALGDSGAVVTNSDTIADMVRKLSDHGRGVGDRYVYRNVGYNERMSTLQAKLLSIKMKYLPEWTRKRKSIAARYDEAFKDILTIPQCAEQADHVYHLYVIQSPKRDELCAYLNEQGIKTTVKGTAYVIPLHKQEALKDEDYSQVSLPHTEAVGKEILCLPMFPEMTDEEVQYVIDTVKAFFKQPSSPI